MPLVTLARAARPSSRGTSSVSQLFVRAVTFALLATLSSLHIATLVASSLSPDSHAAEYIKAELGLGKVPLARVGYTLGAVTWAFARLARRADVASQEPYRGKPSFVLHLLKTSLRPLLSVLQLSAIAITLMSLTRPANLFLFVLLWLQHYALSQSPLAPLTTAAATIALQHVSFFAFGGSNSLATYGCPSSSPLSRANLCESQCRSLASVQRNIKLLSSICFPSHLPLQLLRSHLLGSRNRSFDRSHHLHHHLPLALASDSRRVSHALSSSFVYVDRF